MNEPLRFFLRCLFLVALIIVFSLSPFPYLERANSQSGSSDSYGGLQLFTLYCSCTQNFLLFILDYKVPTLLLLLYDGSATIYQNRNVPFNIGGYLLGSYTTSSSNQCEIYIYSSCVQIPNSGILDGSPGTGTS